MRGTPVLRRGLLGALLVLLMGTTGIRCGGSFYALTDAAAWLEGCIAGPCECPSVQYRLEGTFVLEELPTAQPGPFTLFEVRNVRWRFRRAGQIVEITGGGLYRTAPVLDQHQLTLDLRKDGVRLPTVDSGLVAGARTFPAIEIGALTPEFCFQHGVDLSAKPL